MTVTSGWSRRRMLKTALGSAAMMHASTRLAWAAPRAPDVLILGAGLAGLSAALNLEDAGFTTQILEGTDRVGGRLYTAPESEVPGHPELGGSGIGSSYARLIYAAERFGVELEASRPRTEPRSGELIYHVRGAAVRPEDWQAHELNPFSQQAFREMPLHVVQFLIYGNDNPLPRGDLEAWQSGRFSVHDISVHDYLIQQGVAPQAIKLGAGTNMSYGSNPHDLSMLMGYQSSNLIRSLFTGEGALPSGGMAGAGGNQRIPEGIARGLKSEIVMDAHVRGIRSTSSGVEVTTVDGRVFSAEYCICTFPFSSLRHVQVEPYLEGKQAEAVSSLGYTPVFEVHFVPTQAFWEDDKLPPSMWTDRTPGRFMALRNNPKQPDEITSYLSFVNGEMALYLDRLGHDAAVQTILDDLAQMRPATKGALKPIKVWSWNRTPFAGGAYAYWKPGQITRFASEMRRPWKRIHFAGEHTAVLNRGMEGAMESGERAAFEVMDRIA